MQEKIITMFCSRCKRSLRVDYIISNSDLAPVLPSVVIRCSRCNRAITFKNYTEGKLKEIAVKGTVRI